MTAFRLRRALGVIAPACVAAFALTSSPAMANPQAALDAPRFQWSSGRTVMIEPGFSDTVYTDLEGLGHRLKRSESRTVSFGRGQAIHALPDGWCAGSDLRADGQAVGF